MAEAHARNALRVARTLGDLKGAAMKVGQMLSLQDDLLPEPMREALRGLQKSAPPVGFDRLRPTLEAELGSRCSRIAAVDEQSYASASIGQVHRARLSNGQPVVIKIQYPDVERMVAADLRNIRLLARSLGALTSAKADLKQIAREVEGRLSEELDYRIEAHNMAELGGLLRSDERFLVPRPIEDLCSRRVLVSEYLPGISADEIVSERYPQSLRDRIGHALVETLTRQVFEYHLLHADPNLANFAFTESGNVIVYDFGCVKRFAEPFTEALRQLSLDGWSGRYDRIVEDLERLGYVDRGKRPMPIHVHQQYADALFADWRAPGLYDFGSSPLRDQLIALDRTHWYKAFDFEVPPQAVFLGRTVGGTFGNLKRLRARVPMHDIMRRYVARNTQ
jgi:predicted unusual protein kinase regulating ubiquinone biosynthesis (AarF/ABC1/UbiB family)